MFVADEIVRGEKWQRLMEEAKADPYYDDSVTMPWEEVIKGSAGNSWMFENRVPHILEGDYTPLSAVEIFVKDLGIVQDIARQERFPAPIAAAALQMYLATSGAGMGGDDDASLARLYAQLSGTVLPGNSGGKP